MDKNTNAHSKQTSSNVDPVVDLLIIEANTIKTQDDQEKTKEADVIPKEKVCDLIETKEIDTPVCDVTTGTVDLDPIKKLEGKDTKSQNDGKPQDLSALEKIDLGQATSIVGQDNEIKVVKTEQSKDEKSTTEKSIRAPTNSFSQSQDEGSVGESYNGNSLRGRGRFRGYRSRGRGFYNGGLVSPPFKRNFDLDKKEADIENSEEQTDIKESNQSNNYLRTGGQRDRPGYFRPRRPRTHSSVSDAKPKDSTVVINTPQENQAQEPSADETTQKPKVEEHKVKEPRKNKPRGRNNKNQTDNQPANAAYENLEEPQEYQRQPQRYNNTGSAQNYRRFNNQYSPDNYQQNYRGPIESDLYPHDQGYYYNYKPRQPRYDGNYNNAYPTYYSNRGFRPGPRRGRGYSRQRQTSQSGEPQGAGDNVSQPQEERRYRSVEIQVEAQH